MHADSDGAVRLNDGEFGERFGYGRIEILLKGAWSKLATDFRQITQTTAATACSAAGFDGGGRLGHDVRAALCLLASGVQVHTCKKTLLGRGGVSRDAPTDSQAEYVGYSSYQPCREA